MLNTKEKIRELMPSSIWLTLSSLKKIFRLDNSVPMFFLNKVNDCQDNKIIILGNGPSLKNDINFLNEEDVYFCVNNFSTSPEYDILKPKYYLFLDSYFFSDKSHSDWVSQRNKTFSEINDRTTWSMTIYVPSWANLECIKKIIKNKKIKIVKLRVGEFRSSSKVINKFFYNTGFFGPHQVNVLIYAIFISIWLKSKEIIVLGADASFHQDISLNQSTNQLYMNFKHFNDVAYKEPLMKNPDKTKPFTIFEIMDTCAKTFDAHDMLNFFAKCRSVNIYNASSNSLIDSYTRISISDE